MEVRRHVITLTWPLADRRGRAHNDKRCGVAAHVKRRIINSWSHYVVMVSKFIPKPASALGAYVSSLFNTNRTSAFGRFTEGGDE